MKVKLGNSPYFLSCNKFITFLKLFKLYMIVKNKINITDEKVKHDYNQSSYCDKCSVQNLTINKLCSIIIITLLSKCVNKQCLKTLLG